MPPTREHPDLSAVGELYSDHLGQLDALAEPRRPWTSVRYNLGKIASLWNSLFGEENFEAVEAANQKADRDRNIKLEEIALGGARRLNGRRGGSASFKKLDLDGEEIVAVICETARILLLDGEVRERLVALQRTAEKEER